MKVETYEDIDIKLETTEQSAEALLLIQQLGLKGQVSKALEDTGTRFPYRLMTNEELFVYSQLCPSRSKVEDYDTGPIPLEVLKTIAYARSLQDPRIAHLDVWAADSTRVKDPVLVGKESSYGNKFYILARWGEELLPLDVLMPDAIKRWYAQRLAKLTEYKAQIEFELVKACPLAMPKTVSEPYFSA